MPDAVGVHARLDHGDAPRTLGEASPGDLVVVVHTWAETARDRSVVRIISARRPTRREARQYREDDMNSDDMRNEYDFSKAARGKFHRPNASLAPPLDLDPEVLAFLTARAEARGITLSELVNALLKKDIELIEAAE